MNLAIIIAVSSYSNTINNLPGCKNDAEAINQIIRKTGKYEAILYVNDNETSANTKELLSNFILENKINVVNELFFYYSGHGEFSNDEFYYVLSDFDSKKKNQTSLQNSEIDDLIKTLTPELVIKVIDACQSGTRYIKEADVLNKYFNESKQGFKKCYFLNSSLNSQSSFQNENLSFFTFSFLKALREHKSKEIRYKDIIDVISDEFFDNQEQTPFFVIQAELTEKFCTFSTELREYLNRFDENSLSDNETKNTPIPLKLSDLVKKAAKDYVDKDGAIEVLKFVKEEISLISLSSELAELYKLHINFLEEYERIPSLEVIGKWLKKNKNDYFAQIIYENKFDYDTGDGYQSISGFDLKFETPFKAISIEITSTYPNLTTFQCNIVFLISKTQITFFYFVTDYIEENWDNKSLNKEEIKWLYTETKIASKEAIKRTIEMIKSKIENVIHDDLSSKFDLQPPIDDLPF